MAQAGQGGNGAVSVAVLNKARGDLGAPLDKMVAALQKAYDRDFVPVWGYQLKLYITSTPKPSDWQFIFLDTSDEANALGYHDLTVNGQPISKVFVEDTRKAKEVVSVTASHELYEMAIDPLANLWAQDGNGLMWAYEMSDPVEEDVYDVDGIKISNFVHPSWFEAFNHPVGTKFDHLGLLKKPFSLTKGGYAITMKGGRIIDVFGSRAKEGRFARENRDGHRSEFRRALARRRRRA